MATWLDYFGRRVEHELDSRARGTFREFRERPRVGGLTVVYFHGFAEIIALGGVKYFRGKREADKATQPGRIKRERGISVSRNRVSPRLFTRT